MHDYEIQHDMHIANQAMLELEEILAPAPLSTAEARLVWQHCQLMHKFCQLLCTRVQELESRVNYLSPSEED